MSMGGSMNGQEVNMDELFSNLFGFAGGDGGFGNEFAGVFPGAMPRGMPFGNIRVFTNGMPTGSFGPQFGQQQRKLAPIVKNININSTIFHSDFFLSAKILFFSKA